jgi:3-oxoacyl-[acyl-carrier protein] reductase
MSYADLKDRVYVVTGASKGMGRDLAIRLAQQGAHLGLIDLKEPKETAHEIEKLGGQAVAFTADVRNAEALDHAIRTVAETFGRLDGGANMAGYTGQTSLNSMGKEWDDMLGVNLSGVKNSIVSQLRYMKGTGSIVNAASISGQSGNPHFSAYSSSKWGVIGLTKSVAQEVGDRGIRVNAVAPYVLNYIHYSLVSQYSRYPLTHDTAGDSSRPIWSRICIFLLN